MKSKLSKVLLCSATLCFLLFSHYSSYAQSIVDTTYSYNMNHVFTNLNKSKIPNGLLRDYAMEFTNIDNYSGSALTDSNKVDKGIFREIYMTLATARLTSAAVNTLPSPTTIDSTLQALRKQGQVTLSGLYYNYGYLSSTAVSDGKITVTNNQLFDKYVNGVYQNPYLKAATVAFAPSVAVYNSKSFNILLPGKLWLSNSKSLVDHIEIDANDGLGYRTITPSTALPVTYADTGLKVWNFKIFLTSNVILVSHTQITVYNYQTVVCNASGCGTYIPPGGSPAPHIGNGQVNPNSTPADGITGSNPYYFNTGETYGGTSAQGMVTIQYGYGHTTLVNPLIVVEGFDPGIYLTPENAGGYYTLKDFINSTSYSSDLYNLIANNQNSAQYDIVFIDFHNGTDDIRRNALLVKSVIRWVNTYKTGTNSNVVLGLSMGGLVARYALKKMETAGETPKVRLFINHGGPQLGADIPLGLQYLETDINSLYLRSGIPGLYDLVRLFAPALPVVSGILTLSNTPAAEEMLLSHVNTSFQIDNSVRSAWQTELTALGYPTTCRNVAISNGSECGQLQTLGQNGQIFYLDGVLSTSFLGDLAASLASPFVANLTGQGAFILGVLPGRNQINLHYTANAGQDGGGNSVYNGKITYKKTIFNIIPITSTITNRSFNDPSGILPYETFPGDFFKIPSVPSAIISSGILGRYNITLSTASSFGFIPTASVLDIGKGSTALTETDFQMGYSHDNPPAAPKNSPFNNFVTAYYLTSVNEQHITYENRNGLWLTDELNAQPVTTGCSILCQATQINGSSQPICSSAVYSISSAIPASAISWSISPSSGTASINPNGNNVTVTRTGNGIVTLTAYISTSALCSTTLVKQLNIGLPGAGSITGPASGCTRDPDDYTFSAPGTAGATAWNWSTNPTTSFINVNGNSLATIGFNTAGFYGIECDITVPCGVVQTFGSFSASDCGGSGPNYSIYPNPANNSMALKQNNTPLVNAYNTKQANAQIKPTSFSYKIYNKKGQVLKQGKSLKGETLNINTSDLLNDTYYIHILTGTTVLKKQIVISHN